ncbi:MAG: hypothetical protein U9N85_03405 [Bacteroidota bacterium]|nr:hypothetical protein [Bacteroidota bacterium]
MMPRIINHFTVLISVLLLSISGVSAQIEVTGIYRGENVYILNPLALGGVGFCIYEVRVNGEITTDEINSNAFEVDLSSFNFKHGDQVHIELNHKYGCEPKILNPEVLEPKSTYKLQSISVSKKGYLTWSTKEEKGSLLFIVEQYRWNKWVRIGTIKGKGESGLNRYYKSVNFHSGTNKFRVKQVDFTKTPRISKSAEYRNLAASVTFLPGNAKKAKEKLTFSAKTKYEIYNHYGTLIKRGTAKTVNISGLKDGNYFLNYDNSTASFIKK